MSSTYHSYVISSTALKVLLLGVICILWWQDVKFKPHWHARQLTLQTQMHRRRRWAVSPIMDTMQTFTFWLNQCWNSNQNSNLLLPWKKPVCKVDRNDCTTCDGHCDGHYGTTCGMAMANGGNTSKGPFFQCFIGLYDYQLYLKSCMYYGIMISYASYYNPLNVLCRSCRSSVPTC